jgi:hypothetical protein
MDPNREFYDSCFDTNEDSGIAYKDYHGFIENNFGKNYMLTNSYAQGICFFNF